MLSTLEITNDRLQVLRKETTDEKWSHHEKERDGETKATRQREDRIDNPNFQPTGNLYLFFQSFLSSFTFILISRSGFLVIRFSSSPWSELFEKPSEGLINLSSNSPPPLSFLPHSFPSSICSYSPLQLTAVVGTYRAGGTVSTELKTFTFIS